MKFSIKDILFIVSLTLIFSQYTKLVDISYYTQFIIGLIWILYDMVVISIQKKKCHEDKEITFFRKIFLIPWILIAIYSLFLYSIHQNENVKLNTYIAANGTILINTIFAFSALHIFRGKALRNSLIALIIVYILVTCNAIISYGPNIIIDKLREIFTTFDSKANPFEIGDCTFAAGLIFLIYLFYGKAKTKKEIKYLFVCGFFIILGLKRIQILSIVLVVLIGSFFKIVKKKRLHNILMNICLLAIILIATFYLHLIVERLDEWTGLDMGRFNLYSFMANYVDFTPSFLGHGYGFSNKFVELNTNFSIIVLHNDIMRMYIELGFCGFYIWLLYYLYLARKKIENKYGHFISCQFFFMTMYLFVTYFTDNTINYFVTQYFYCLILPALLIGNSKYFPMKETATTSREQNYNKDCTINKELQ